jgi:hAT family C-terminal dimerisation region
VEGASCGDQRIEAVATLLLRDFNVRWGAWPRSTLISVALDPRTKKMKCFTDAEQLNAWALIKKEMHAMYTVTSQQQQQQQEGGSSGAAAAATGSTSNVGSGSNAERSVLDDLLGDDSDDPEDHALDTIVDAEYVLQQRTESEVKLYKTLSKLGSSQSDNPLAWWSSHARDYPLLAAVARNWLAVPASSAASERVFSSAGLTVSNKRTRLRVDIVSILVFLKTAWPTLERAGASRQES